MNDDEGDEPTILTPEQRAEAAAKSAAARDEAMERVEHGVSEEWKAEAFDTIVKIAAIYPEVTSDLVWEAGLEKPHEPRALASIMRNAAAHGVLKETGRYDRTSQVSGHRRPMAIWRSLIQHDDDHIVLVCVAPKCKHRYSEVLERTPGLLAWWDSVERTCKKCRSK